MPRRFHDHPDERIDTFLFQMVANTRQHTRAFRLRLGAKALATIATATECCRPPIPECGVGAMATDIPAASSELGTVILVPHLRQHALGLDRKNLHLPVAMISLSARKTYRRKVSQCIDTEAVIPWAFIWSYSKWPGLGRRTG